MDLSVQDFRTLREDEIINLLCRTQIVKTLNNELLDVLITRGFNSKDKNFQLNVIDYLKADIDRFLESITKWVKGNSSSIVISNPRIRLDYCEVSSPSNFIELSLSRLGVDNIEKILELLKQDNYATIISSLRSVIFLIDKYKDKLYVDSLNSYVNKVIDVCIDNFEDSLIKVEVSRFLGKINSKDAIAILEYFIDNESDFTLRMVSLIGLDNIQKMNRSKTNKGDSENKKKILLSYRR